MYKSLLTVAFALFLSQFSLAGELRVATFNAGMLNVGSPVPLIDERQSHLKSEILKTIGEQDIDVLALQELWTDHSHEVLKNIHPAYQLVSVKPDAWVPFTVEHGSGLAYLVKKDLYRHISFIDNKTRESYVCGFGNVCDRGFLELAIEFADKRITILNSHFTPIFNLLGYRQSQMLELIRYRDYLFENKKTDIVMIAGDLNISPYFEKLRAGDEGSEKDWSDNAQLYYSFFHSAQNKSLSCEDAYDNSAIAPNYKYTQDRNGNSLTKLSDSTKIEPSQRIDHVFICSPKNQWRVLEVKSLFDRPIKDTKLFLSDHYGVLARIAI